MDESRERLGQLDANYDLLTKQGSPTSLQDLRDLGIRDVDLYIAVTPDEARRVYAALYHRANDYCYGRWEYGTEEAEYYFRMTD